MRFTIFKFSLLAVLAVALVVSAVPASATTVAFSQSPYSATLNVGTSSAVLTLSGPTSGFFVYEVALQMSGTASSTGTGSASSGTWTFLNAAHPNDCTTGSTNNWLCAITTTAQAGNGLMLTFNFTGTASTNPADYSLHFIICDTKTTCTPGSDAFVTIFSQEGKASTVPEPGTLSLLGTGLIGLAGLVRKRLLS